MAKGSIRVAKKYAKALIALYQPALLEEVRTSLTTLAKLWEESADLRSVILNPGYKINERLAVVQTIVEKVRPGDKIFANFLALLVDAGRIQNLSLIADSFSALVDELKNLLALKITSAFPMSVDEQAQFKTRLEKDFGSLASIEWEVDSDIIGGLKVRAGDKLLDSSIRGSLEKLQSALVN